ncbi:hypothetical protein [Planococcus sp. S3-L1]|uniref:hypothetical protein n=1 Tax=Planococcus sp. S3-L1 TaxID=3046200 RepID=UPI0024BA52E7|nr:hypothetical protein [Planococcus sp. S3-L1]MDJ0331899.1 hypothetical protein [Planococcus sp. S3-L1]
MPQFQKADDIVGWLPGTVQAFCNDRHRYMLTVVGFYHHPFIGDHSAVFFGRKIHVACTTNGFFNCLA